MKILLVFFTLLMRMEMDSLIAVNFEMHSEILGTPKEKLSVSSTL